MAINKIELFEDTEEWLAEEAGKMGETNCPEACLMTRFSSYQRDWYQLIVKAGDLPTLRDFIKDAIKNSYKAQKYTYK